MISDAACLWCPSTRTSDIVGASNVSQCRCLDDMYDSLDGSLECKPCQLGGVCKGGDPPVSSPGYYIGDENDGFVECLPSISCIGESRCAVGYTGERCSKCAAGYHRAQVDCEKCVGMSNF